MVTTISSSTIISSKVISFVSLTISVRRTSPNSSCNAVSSSLMMLSTSRSLERISLKRAMALITSLYSSTIFSRSRPVSRCSRMSRMAWACTTVRPNRSISRSLATAGVFDCRIKATTSSRLSRAIFNPSNRWARSSAFFKSYRVRRMMISLRWMTNSSRSSFRVQSWGRLLTTARKLMPKLTDIWVSL